MYLYNYALTEVFRKINPQNKNMKKSIQQTIQNIFSDESNLRKINYFVRSPEHAQRHGTKQLQPDD